VPQAWQNRAPVAGGAPQAGQRRGTTPPG
jgi:hypothetical protein